MKLKQLFHIEAIENGDTEQQVLLLRTGERHCGFAITDQAGDKLYELAYYSIEGPVVNPLEDLIQLNSRLGNSFYKILLSYDYPQSMLVPAQQYSQEDTEPLLKNLYPVNGQQAIVSESITEWDVYNVYAVPKELLDWVNRRYVAGSSWHQYTLDIKNLDVSHANGHLLIDFRKDDFTLVAANGSRLLLTRTFSYSTPEDVLYYLLRVCQEFGFSQQQVQLSISGLIDRQSALYKELYQYFINISLRESGWTLPGDDYPSHFFTSFNDLARCAS